ncbi:MAG: phosphate acyltransferase PlsX [Lachnospiraceae bacterium]|nr:phosphate acyltransferase PlsX [Lachnospiraceae bacterium]
MSKQVKVVLDAMGGDYAPKETVKGAVEALEASKDIHLILTGKEDEIKKELENYPNYDKNRLEIINATEVIGFNEQPVEAIRGKKDSSLVVGMKLLKKGEADAFVSAGSTGAILVGGQLLVGRLKGIERSPLAPLLPTKKGQSLLIDCGANVDSKASNLVQFAQMGSIYMKNIVGIENPKVAIVNVGVEEEKGNKLVKEAFPLLRECKDINFVGSVEAKEIPEGNVDVIVCDAFVGNVILKLYEGLGKTFLGLMKEAIYANTKSKIGGALIKGSLKESLKNFNVNASDVGGAPMLGLKGLVIKSHGSSDSKEIMNAILQCIAFSENDINTKISESISVKAE